MTNIKPITSKQKVVLNFINSFLVENGYSPSLRDIASHIKVTNLSTAQYFVEELLKKGYLDKRPNSSRGITPKTSNQTVPMLGYIAAGKPIEPIETPTPIQIPSSITLNPQYPHYALKIKGDSMMDMGILNGDTVLIRHQLTANDGDVIVGITEDGATLKVFRKKDHKIVLEPRNNSFPKLYPKQLEIRGKFIGLIRTEK